MVYDTVRALEQGFSIVVSKVVLSVVSLAAAGLLTKSLFLLRRVDPGFNATHLLTLQVDRPILAGSEAQTGQFL